MIKKEDYILAGETKIQVKQTAKERAGGRRMSVAQDKSDRRFDYIDGLGKFVVNEVDESSLTEYVRLCLANIDLARERMSNDQIEIDRLRDETRSLLADLTAM